MVFLYYNFSKWIVSPFEVGSFDLRWPAGRGMSKTRGVRFSHILIDRHLIHVHTKAFFKMEPINIYYQTTYNMPLLLLETGIIVTAIFKCPVISKKIVRFLKLADW